MDYLFNTLCAILTISGLSIPIAITYIRSSKIPEQRKTKIINSITKVLLTIIIISLIIAVPALFSLATKS